MSRAALLGLLVFFLVLGGLVGLHGSLLALSIPIILYWAYAIWRGPDEIILEADRELQIDRTASQVPVTIRLTITNLGGNLEQLALEDVLPPDLKIVSGSSRHLISLSKAETFVFEYEVQGPRGAYTFDQISVEAADHLGLLRRRANVRAPGQLSVLPVLSRIREVRIRPRRTRVYAGTIPARAGGTGVEFFGVRPYLPGDAPRHVNWRASARHGEQLYSNEFQQERVADVAIVLDGRERSNLQADGHSLFEHSVMAAGSMADALLQQGNRVGLLVYSQYLHWTLPGYGKIQRQRILGALARAAPGGSQIFEGLQYLPTRLFPAESQIILVSPVIDEDYSTLVKLRARGYQVLVVSPDPVSFESRLLPPRGAKYGVAEVQLSARILRLERAWLLRRIRAAGIRVIEWDVLQPFDQVTRRAFSRASDMRYPL